MAKAEKVLSAEELDKAIAHEREPAQRRAERIAAVSAALLAGPETERRGQLEDELAELKAQRHTRSPQLAGLLEQRRELRLGEKTERAASYATSLKFDGKSDEQLEKMAAEQREALVVARSVLSAVGAEMDRRQARAANAAKLDKLSSEELSALEQDIKERRERLK